MQNANLKILFASHLALLIAGFVIGYMVQKEPSTKTGKTTVEYRETSSLGLPKFNLSDLKPVNRIYFIPGPEKKGERDTVYVPMPPSYTNDFLVTQRDPVSKQGNEIQFKYYDPKMDKQVIDQFEITASPWKFGVHVDIDNPLYTVRPQIGPKLEVGYKAIKFNLKAQLDVVKPRASTVTIGTSIRLFGNN